MMSVLSASAQTDTIRYVNAKTGKYANDGKSWKTAKDNVQDAINDLYDYMQRNNLHSGSVYVAAGTYTPSESTGDGASVLSTSFKIYDGIHVYGGFNADDPEDNPDKRMLSAKPAWRDGNMGKANDYPLTDGDKVLDIPDMTIGALENEEQEHGDGLMRYDFKYATIFSGNHNTVMGTFKWNDSKKQYDTRFPGNSYHVVWFATNGYCKDDKGNNTLYADSLVYGASLDGCIIQDGNASGRSTEDRDLNAFGGGVYMVQHATLRNCVIRRCSASRRGGGVYMDRGGTIRDCYIYQCQTLGMGVTDGYGGGVCMENNGVMRHTSVTNNMARIGGGLMIVYTPELHPYSKNYKKGDFDPYASVCVFSNNNANTEGAGVVLYKGGVLNHCTIVRNECTGTDITTGGVRYGRTGGLFIYGAGSAYNGVVWGNTCAVNNDIQYGYYTTSDIFKLATAKRPRLGYMAFSNFDITDWGNTLRNNVYQFSKDNFTAGKAGNYPVFTQPSATAGVAGATAYPMAWIPNAKSYLRWKGVQVSQLTNFGDVITKSHSSQDFIRNVFNPVSALGAFAIIDEAYEVAQLPAVDGSKPDVKIPTLFVDPNRVVKDINESKNGSSWDTPLDNLSEAVNDMEDYIKQHNITSKTQILVKQGTVTPAGPGAYLRDLKTNEADLQSAALKVASNMLVYGGYSSSLTSTDVSKRNPKENVTRISGNIVDRYVYNSVHCVVFPNVHDAVLDGFYISYGNAEKPDDPNYKNSTDPQSYEYRLAYGYGGGIFLGSRFATDRSKPMTGNIVRNCVISNCWAPMGGGAVFVSGDNLSTDNTLQKAELTLENCIIHNNAVRNKQDKNTVNQWSESAGIIEAVGNATITMKHCTVVNNVGNVFAVIKHNGNVTPTINVTNSAIYSNATDSLTDRTQLKADGSNLAALYYTGNGGNAPTGSNNYIDLLYKQHTGLSDDVKKNFVPTFGNDRSDDKTYPRFVNPVRTIFVQRNTDDPTLYGGTIDYTPMNMNPMVNAATVEANENVTTETDFALNHRNYGGKPDIGAIENTTQPEDGSTYYVRTPETGGDDSHDGKSWATAFATIEHALNTATSGKKVWVAQGVYRENLIMKDGVDVYGGFKSYGNPGKRDGERDISNLKSDYQTVIDGQFKGHVLNQDADFSNATTWEGLTIQNGTNLVPASTGSVSTISETTTNSGSSDWSEKTYGTKVTKTITRTFTSQYTIYYNGYSPLAVGGGAYILKNATLKNCLIRYNRYFQSYPSSITVKIAPTTTYTTTTTTKASADAEEVTVTKDSVSNVPYMAYEAPTSGTTFGSDLKKGGGGIYLGSGATLENCVVRNNEGKIFNNNNRMVGCGIYSNGGTVLNSLIVENFTSGGNCLGAAMCLESKSLIYNTTIAYNLVTNINGLPCCPGVWDKAVSGGDRDFATKCSIFYNTMFWANIGYGNTAENFNQVCRSGYPDAIGKTGHMINCYHSVPSPKFGNAGVSKTNDIVSLYDLTQIYNTGTITSNDASKSHVNDGVTAENTNKYYTTCKAQNLFNESSYIYPTASEATQITSIETDNPYSINRSSELAKYCINMGADEYGDVLKNTYGITEDIAGADRIQDCRIDKGAYEYNGASKIKPKTGTETHKVYSAVADMKGTDTQFNVATFYVSQNGGGVADASTPDNAACGSKLQQVLDAAGRYKYDHPAEHVVVKLAAIADGGYTPSRTTDYNANVDINPRQFSIQIPHGVEVQGGWNDTFTKRDPLNNKTLLTGVFNYDGGTSTAYHVVTFTDYVFDENGQRISKGKDADGLPIYELLSEKVTTYKATWEKTPGDNLFSRAELNGCFIENGQADGVLPEDQRGGAAVVTGFADITNCVIQNNKASGYGGGLYVQPSGIVSGSILQDNTAAYGAGIAIEEPETTGLDTWAILAYNTIVYNNASSNGGGIFFNTNLRSIGNVVWMNESNDQSDIAGVVNVDAQQDVWNFPVNYSAVTNVREAGVNNISVNSNSDEGVRWTAGDKKTETRPYQYYALQKSSVLTRAALPYTTMRNMIRFFPGIDSVDIAGVKRMAQTDKDPVQAAYDGTTLVVKNNVSTDIGARAINASYDITLAKVFYRLFVVHPTNVTNDKANALLESNDEIYKQVGSSFANPFQRLGDAFDYIMHVRQREESADDKTPEKDKPRNHRFEVFVAGGTYFPYTNMYGEQGAVRSNTFNIPEGVTVIGGIDVSDPTHMYCQETTDGKTVDVKGVTLYGCSTDNIRNQRERYDINKNSIVEPWEMKNQTILSGLSVGADLEVKNVYHVINCNADEKSVGKLPEYFSDANLTTITTNASQENLASRMNRTIILDGLIIRDGSAMGYESTVQNKMWYFRGGGIFVDGTTSDDAAYEDGVGAPKRSIPMVVSNTLFQNNSARLGGAIYTNGQLDVVGCSFVQNYSKSPDNTAADADDCKYVSWSGGGAIATNDEVTIVNSIFANNEARKGTGTLTKTYTNKNNMTNNQTLGYGGVLWAGDNSSIAVINCNSVRNKAHSFPSIYNTLPNSSSNNMHIAVNSIFWGNEVDEGGNVQLANFGDDKAEALFFCAYQNGHGQEVKTSPTDKRAYDDNLSYDKLSNLYNYLGGNNNVIISDNNDAVDGPNFIMPSSKAGVDGYMQSADWLISRVNLLTDAGWGEIDQDEKGNYKKDANGKFEAHGIYPDLSKFFKDSYNLTLLPLGDEKYMDYADDKSEESKSNMNRISADPLGNTTKDYIDIGVYEYQHSQLTVADGDEIDVMWVSDEERTGAKTADGRSWDTPTSDLQRAIETLLLSRNDKPKVLKVMGGTYSPTYTLDESNNGFQIHTGANTDMVALKKTIISGHDYMAQSLTIEGGYSKEIEGARDIEQNPTILQMAKKSTSTSDNMAHLFLISDAEQWGTQGNKSGGGTSDKDESIDLTKNTITKSSKSTGKVMPITFDGLTFVNNYASSDHKESAGSDIGGAAIYYKAQFKSDVSDPTTKTKTELDATGVPKLTIKNCIFQQNGATGANTVPAVRIERGGGRTLIYNSVFHSGSGNPLECTDTVSIVNCTFAMNGGHIKLSDAATGKSSLYNSIIWKDDQNNSMKTQYEGFSENNAATDSVQYNAVFGIANTDEKLNNHNVGLDSRNYNAMEGPNFVNGDGSDISKRDYHINPGVRTLTRANYLLYAQKVLGWVPGMTIKDKKGADVKLDKDNILTMLADTAYTKDLAYKVRLYDGSMERGAYECSSAMQRVLFVEPNKVTGNMTGLSWQDAYGSGMVQRAVDAAAVYTYFNNKTAEPDEAKSYVFIKGSGDNATPEVITLRNGVSVYGSIAQTYTKEPKAVKDANGVMYNNGARTFQTADIASYINNVKADRPGLVAKTTKRTQIAGIATMTTDYSLGALVDGFEIKSAKALTAPAVDITDDIDSLVLRNMMIDHNTVNADDKGTGHPVVNLQHGLLYNTLVYANQVVAGQPLVSVGANGTMLNCTVVADAAGQQTVNNAGTVINGLDFNRIDNKEEETTSGSGKYTNCYAATGNPFAPYLRSDGNVYNNLPTFLTNHTPYYYQLHENSKAIDAGKEDFTLPDRFAGFVDLKNDRDVLGNPRKLGNAVDMGCFETWRIADKDSRYAKAADNHYPHEGSVVYIGKNASLSLGVNTGDQIFTGENAFMPGYLLLKTGASLYGNGNVVHVAYVAAERTFPAPTQYTLMSMPFPYDYANALTTATDNNGNITETKYAIPKGKTYNGEKRSAWDYDFHTSDSPCWETMTSTAVKACDGWLLNFGTPLSEETVIRFTGFGSKEGDYVYTEDGAAKTVTLTQYNQVPIDGSAHFTKLENMGWNLKGMPWLVSGYNTAHLADGKSYDMSAPHVFYTVSNDGNTFSASQSWDADGPTLDFGNAFFTQTAVIGDGSTEKVTFALPPLPSKTPTLAAKPYVALSDDSGFTDDVEVKADEDSKQLAFNIGSDGVKWQSFNDSVPQVYLLDNSGVALSLAGQAPVGVEMAMGYRTVKDGQLTVSLPNAEAFDGQNVWLKDKMTGAVTDLTQSAYILQASKGYTDNRLTLQIGGVRPDGTRISKEENDASWTVRVVEGRLQVNGIHTDDLVIIRTLSGAPVTRGRASSDTFVSQPLVHGVYVVTVNNRSKKVGL
jgi:predicted outer membrane repeat protein